MTAGNQPLSSVSKSAFDICVMIVEEECYLDASPAKGNDYERAIHEVGLAIRDRIRCAQQGAGGGAQPPRTPLDRKTLDELIQRHASAYVARGSAISDSIIAECKASREALLALSAVTPSPGPDREGTLKMVAGIFSESVHDTYTREEVVSIVEDMIRVGRPTSSVASTNRLCPNGLEHGNCGFPNCVSSCPGRLSLTSTQSGGAAR
jgi:hypothetical protein